MNDRNHFESMRSAFAAALAAEKRIRASIERKHGAGYHNDSSLSKADATDRRAAELATQGACGVYVGYLMRALPGTNWQRETFDVLLAVTWERIAGTYR